MMKIDAFPGLKNPYRGEILALMERNNETTVPPLSEMTHRWLLSSDKQLDKPAALARFYDELADTAVIALKDETVLGFFLLKDRDDYFKERAPDYWPSLAITLALVRESHRRSGVSRALLDYVETRICPDQNVPYLAWSTSTENTASQRFAESHGFTRTATVKDDRGQGVDTLIYAKET